MHPNDTVLNDYVDEALGAAERGEVERHLPGCDACRALVEDLGAIRSAAAALDPIEPPARAWPRLERAVRFETGSPLAPQGQNTSGRRIPQLLRGSWTTWLAAAAAILIAVAVGLRYRPHVQPAAPVAATTAASGEPSAAAVEAELRAAEQHYDNAIKGLEQITNAEKGTLDAQTAATLQKNLAVIDQAISESRAAVRAQPASEPAQQSLIESFKAKLALLQDTVALINEMRKGNEAGAARIGSALRQKG